MSNEAKKRFDSATIIDKILDSVQDRDNIIAHTVTILETIPHYTWVGIYLVEGEYLILKHYIGRPTEHTRIKIGHGICGAAVADEHTIIVSDVSCDHRYIACSKETRSEIVVPIWSNDRIIGEIDIDSDCPNAFDIEDKKLLEQAADILGDVL